jgi:lysophospholipase L1-like esterase
MTGTVRFAAVAATFALLAGCMTAPELAPGSKYVAMGSSFAAGPGIPTYVDNPPGPCSRSDTNYAHQIAKRKGLTLVDVSCSGGTTAHLLGPRGAIPPQLDAVDADTRLVTVTIGGNDVNYMSRLTAASCAGLAQQNGAAAACNPVPAPPTEQAYADLAVRMDQIAKEVRRRAPSAHLVFVDYLAVLPEAGTCPGTPLSAAEADADREIARRLAAITRKAAGDNGASIILASEFSKGHDACSKDPWINGYPRPEAPVAGTLYHPNARGMTVIADALEKLLDD